MMNRRRFAAALAATTPPSPPAPRLRRAMSCCVHGLFGTTWLLLEQK